MTSRELQTAPEHGQLAELDTIYRHAPIGLCVLDTDLRWVRLNERMAEMNGVPLEDHLGRTPREVLGPEIGAQAEDALRHILATGETLHFELTGATNAQPGVQRSWEEHWSPLTDADGCIIGVSVVVKEITGRKRTREALRVSEERFRVAQELSLDAFTILDAVRDATGRIVDFRWQYTNPAAGRILRHAPDTLVGRRLLQVLPGNKTHSDLFETYVRVVETGIPHDYELCYDAEGIRGWFRNMAVKLGDGVAICFTDITARRQAEEALRESEARQRIALDAAQLGVWQHDLVNDIITLDARAQAHYGFAADRITVEALLARLHPDDADRLRHFIGEEMTATAGEGFHPLEYRVIHPDGDIRWLAATVRVLFTGTGATRRAVQSFGTSQDITARKQADEALRESEERLRLATTAAQMYAWEVDLATQTFQWSGEARRLAWLPTPNTLEELWLTIHPEDQDAAIAVLGSAFDLGGDFTLEFRYAGSPPDNPLWFAVTGVVLLDAGGAPARVVGMTQDITARKRAEEALRESEARLAHAERLALIGHWEWDLDTGAMRWSPGVYHVLEAPETLEPSLGLVMTIVHPDDHAAFTDILAQARAGEPILGIDLRGTTPGGKDGYVHLQGEVVRDAAGRAVKLFGTVQDITARKRLEQALQEADRAKDAFLSVLSHELRTPITSIIGWSAQALKQPEPALLMRALEVVQRNAHRQKAMVDGLLDVSRLLNRKIELQPVRVDLRAEARQAVESLQMDAEERLLTLTCLDAPEESQGSAPSLGSDPRSSGTRGAGEQTENCGGQTPEALFVLADPERLQQCLGNLLQNSLKFTPPGGEITVTCRRQGRRAVLAVQDTGRGLRPDDLAAIFQPFRQVDRDERAGGLGLGLAITRGLVELHGGAITAASPGPGQGSTFTITLPLAAE